MKKMFVLLSLCMIFVAACSQAPEDNPPPLSELGLDPDKQAAFNQLSEDIGQEPEILVENGIPRFITLELPLEATDPESALREFFNTYAGLYGLEDPDSELRLDSLREVRGGTLVRFSQYMQGLPVYAADTASLITDQNSLSYVNGALQPTMELSTEPEIDRQAAIASAVESSGDPASELAREPQLMFFSPGVLSLSEGEVVLAWELGLLVDHGDGGPPLLTQFLIDATSGDPLFDVLEEPSEENWNLYDAQNALTATGARTLSQAVLIYENKDGDLSTLLDENNNPLTDAEGTIAQENMAATWDYFFNTHDWDGHDGEGGTCNIYLNVGVNWANASCGAACNCRFGDRTADWAVPLDVLAHEFAHAVTGQTAKLVYKNESGAVNEHFSDFFAVMIDTSDWIQANPEGFRDLSDPNLSTRLSGWPAFPDHYDEVLTDSFDNGNVHFNSSILNKAAFMVADTGSNTHPDSNVTVEGIGRAKAEQIWFQALLSATKSTGLHQAASLIVQSAQSMASGDFLTQEEVCEVENAMLAVGLRELSCLCDENKVCPILGGSTQGGLSATVSPDATDLAPPEEVTPEITGTAPVITPEITTTATQVNACDHPYMPIRVGSTWNYVDSDGGSMRLEVLEIYELEGIFEAQLQSTLLFEGETIMIDYTWQCRPEGIDILMGAMYSLPFDTIAEISSTTEGIALPREDNLNIGDTWPYAYTILFRGTSGGETLEVMNDRKENYSVMDVVPVTVPAGEFEGLEIFSDYQSTVTILGASYDFPGQQILWFARGVGLVKNEVVTGDGDITILELVSYNIP